MPLAPAITFRGIKGSDALSADIVTRLRRLETCYDRITRCRVLVELEQRRHESGNRFHVRIDLAVPGDEIVIAHRGRLRAASQGNDVEKVTKAAEADRSHKRAHVAVREAFEVARRRLQDYARRQQDQVRQRGAVKSAPSRTVARS